MTGHFFFVFTRAKKLKSLKIRNEKNVHYSKLQLLLSILTQNLLWSPNKIFHVVHKRSKEDHNKQKKPKIVKNILVMVFGRNTWKILRSCRRVL